MKDAIFAVPVVTGLEGRVAVYIRKFQQRYQMVNDFEVVNLFSVVFKANSKSNWDVDEPKSILPGHIFIRVTGVDPIYGCMPSNIYHLLSKVPHVKVNELTIFGKNTVTESDAIEHFKSILPETELRILLKTKEDMEKAKEIPNYVSKSRSYLETKKSGTIKRWLSIPFAWLKSTMLKHCPELMREQSARQLLELIPKLLDCEQDDEMVLST